MAEIQRGVVKWFNDAKGFGFIEHETGRDVFVHYSVIEQDGFKTLKDGEEVHYELKEGEKGLHAARVARVNIPPEELAAAKEAANSNPESSSRESLEDTALEDTVEAASAAIEVTKEKVVDGSMSSPAQAVPTPEESSPTSILEQ